MRGQNSLVKVLLAQEADKELSWVGVATKLCGVCAEAIPIVGVCWRRKLSCTLTHHGRNGSCLAQQSNALVPAKGVASTQGLGEQWGMERCVILGGSL